MAAGISFQHRDCRTDCAPELWRPRVDGGELTVFADREEATLAGAVETGTSYFWLCGPPYNVLLDGFARDAKKQGAKIIARDKRGSFDVVLRDGGRIRIGDASEWFGEGLDAEACRNAWANFLSLLSEHTRLEGGRWLMPRPTPAQTGRAFFQTYMQRGMAFQRLTNEQRSIIMTGPGRLGPEQHRIETFSRSGSIPALYYYDYFHCYAAVGISLAMPEGAFMMERCGEFIPFRPTWYEIEARVPEDWSHVALVQVGGEWIREPGRVFSGWFAEPEAALLCAPQTRCRDIDAASPLAASWRPTIKRRLVPELVEGYDRKGLRYAIYHILQIAEAGEHIPGVAHACRAILLQGIGSLHPRMSGGSRIEIHEDEFDPADYAGAPVEISRRLDRPEVIVVKSRDGAASRTTEAPQIAAHLWAAARARITRAMLPLPFADIVGVHGDAIYLTRPHEFRSFGRVEAFRLKGSIDASRPAPGTPDDLQALSDEAANARPALAEA
jgi:hypothetical protein